MFCRWSMLYIGSGVRRGGPWNPSREGNKTRPSRIRHMPTLETVNTYEDTQDFHALTIGRDITGMDAFSCEPGPE
jgi:hypothetical protein